MLLETIQKLIKERKLKLKDIAAQINVSPVTLTRNLNGTSEMGIATLEGLISVLGEREFYGVVMDNLQILTFEKLDNQDGVIWGVFLVNGIPSFVGCIENNRIMVYVRSNDTTLYNRKKIEVAVGKGVELEDFTEDTRMVDMWIYQYNRVVGRG